MVKIYICSSHHVKSTFYIWSCKFILKTDVLTKLTWLNFSAGTHMHENGYGARYL